MDKYKDKDGIELSYTGNDVQTKLVKEVIGEAIKILSVYNMNDKISMTWVIQNCKEFIKTNFDIED